MKLNKKNAVIAIVLVAAIALMGFGFAAWTATLTATGSIKGAGSNGTITWDVEWKECVLNSKSVNADAPDEGTITTTTTKNDTITLDDITLDEPGAFAEYNLTATNLGTVKAQFVSLTCEPKSASGKDVSMIMTKVVDVSSDPLCDLEPGADCQFNLVIYIDPDYEGTENSGVYSFSIPDDVTFDLTLDYVQDNADPSGTPSIPTPSHLA